MLPMAATPLPHTIAIELATTHGVTTFDPVFKRHCPLPAEARKTYKADRTLRPSEVDATLPIKFWEIDVSDDPQEKWWAGCVHVRSDAIRRPVPEGADLELTVRIDASRKMTVDVFIPLLNQSLTDDVYVPDPPGARSQLQQQLDLCFERLAHVNRTIYETDRGDLAPRLAELQADAEAIAERVGRAAGLAGDFDPDASLAPTDALRKLRMRLTQLEEQLGVGAAAPTLARKLRWHAPYVERVVRNHGIESEQLEFERLHDQYRQYADADDARGLKWVYRRLWALHDFVVEDKAWYWQERLEVLKRPTQKFLNGDEAAKVLAEADAANTRADLAALRAA